MLIGDMTGRNHATTGRVSEEGVEQEEMRGQDKRNIGKDFTGRGTGASLSTPQAAQAFMINSGGVCVDILTSKNRGLYTGRGNSTCPRCPGQLLKS